MHGVPSFLMCVLAEVFASLGAMRAGHAVPLAPHAVPA